MRARDNYDYDEIGNLISDESEMIERIEWNVYGKIAAVIRKTEQGGRNLADLYFSYDASGNRVSKRAVYPQGGVVTTYYVRDASGNTMAVYSQTESSQLNVQEQHIYGSSRLGMYNPEGPQQQELKPGIRRGWNVVGLRNYELTDHLGNVHVVVSDLKMGLNSKVLSATEYYAFGMSMPGRNFSSGSYRYGFNGQEKDDELKGDGNSLNFKFRMYDPRLGKFFSLDPISSQFPWNSPYAFAENDVIRCVDLEGGEKYMKAVWFTQEGKQVKVFSSDEARANIYNIAKQHHENGTANFENWEEYDKYTQQGTQAVGSLLIYKGDDGQLTYRYFKPLEENPSSSDPTPAKNENSVVENIKSFAESINPVESAEFYFGGLIKTEINVSNNMKMVVPYGGFQVAGNTETGFSADNVNFTQTYFNVKKGNFDFRAMPLNGVGTGDYNPGLRALYTVYKRPIIIPIGDVPVPVGEFKIQGDFLTNPLSGSTKIGGRGAAESYAFPISGQSGIKLELNAGIRFQLKVPDILK